METEYPERNVVVTGGCGFIGSNFVHWLLSCTGVTRIIVVDSLIEGSNLQNISCSKHFMTDRFQFCQGEYGDKKLMSKLLKENNVSIIFHLGGETHVDRSFKEPLKFVNLNVHQTVSLLEVCKEYGKLEKFIYMSTDEIYGDVNDKPCTEESIYNCTNPYSASKAAAEQFAISFFHCFKIPIIIVRSNNVYGPRQADDKVIPKFIRMITKGEAIPLHGGGSQTRNWIYTEDVCRALWLIMIKGVVGEIYNIGSKDEISIMDLTHKLYKFILKYFPSVSNLKLITVQDRPYNDKYYKIDWSKLEKLGWSSKYDFESALENTTKWYLESLNRE